MEAQLGRPVRGGVRVAVRCPCGLPAVIETYPLVDGAPFPTLYWLTCRRARAICGRLEAAGRMEELNRRLRSDPAFAAALEAATDEYVARRDALWPLPGGGGVGGGPRDRVKCLHAHCAHYLVTGTNPVGRWVAEEAGPLLGSEPCA